MGQRIRKNRRVAVDYGDGNGSPRVRDISIGGARALWSQALSIDDSIELVLPGPAGRTKLRGCVVRARRTGLQELPYEYGIKLEPLTPEAHEQLLLFMKEWGIHDAPTTEVDVNQLRELQERIAELERQLARETGQLQKMTASSETAPVPQPEPAAEEQVPAADPGSVTLVTHYDRKRFIRLLELGQPLLVLVNNPSVRLTEHLQQRVIDAIIDSTLTSPEDGIDLRTIMARLHFRGEHQSIIDALYSCYQMDLIDFA